MPKKKGAKSTSCHEMAQSPILVVEVKAKVKVRVQVTLHENVHEWMHIGTNRNDDEDKHEVQGAS